MTSGTVFDIGYQRYTGAREGRDRALRAVFKDGVRAALGLGRGPRAKILPWFFISLLAAIALIMVLITGAAERIAGPQAAASVPAHSDYYAIASIVLFVFAALVAPELLCRDRREGVINLYLVRPLSGSDYVIARWTAFFTVLMVSAWLPQIILFIGLSMDDPSPMSYLAQNWVDVPRFLIAGFVMAAYLTTLALLTSSFTTRRAYASVFLVGLFAIMTPFTVGLAQELEGPVGQWISMFALTNIPLHIVDIIFGDVTELTENAPARQLGSAMLVGWYALWTFVPATVLWSRYRRLSP